MIFCIIDFNQLIFIFRLGFQSLTVRPNEAFASLGDRSIAETVVNVLTSLPFIALGIQAPRWWFHIHLKSHKSNLMTLCYFSKVLFGGCRKNPNCTLYANSLIGVGVASSLYHASRGKARKYLRWADYTMIATSTVVSINSYISRFTFPQFYFEFMC